MKTEVVKTYKHGFLLSEIELRRLIQTCNDHLEKIVKPKEFFAKFSTTLKDGSILETENIEDIFQLENTGNKCIKGIKLVFTEKKKIQKIRLRSSSIVQIKKMILGMQ